MSRRLTLVAASVTLAGTFVLGQDQPTFRAGVQAIEVDVTVRDETGRFVADLTADDFEILEDGVLQTVESMTLAGAVSTSTTTPPAQARDQVGADARREATGRGGAESASAAAPADRTDYVVIVDSGPFPRQKDVLEKFIKAAVRPGDRVALVETPRGLPSELPFVNTPDEMRAAIRGLSGEFCDAMKPASFWMVRDVAARLAREQGARKAIVLIAAGTTELWHGMYQEALWRTEPIRGGELGRRILRGSPARLDYIALMRGAYEEAMRMATVARIPVHTVEPSGLRAPVLPPILRGSEPLPPLPPADGGFDAAQFFRPRTTSPARSAEQEMIALSIAERQSSLRLIAEDTGGTAIVNTNRFEPILKRVAEQRPPSYVLTYTSPANQLDGAFHRIDVRVKRSGLSVRARKGYYAFRPGGSITPAVPIPGAVSARARTALEAPLPDVEIDAAASAASLSVGNATAAVLVGVQVDAPAAFDATKPIEAVWSALNEGGFGALVAVDRKMIGPGERRPAADAPLALFHRMELPEGHYRITSILSQEGGPLALGRTTVEVLSRPTEPFGFTDILIAATSGERREIVSAGTATKDLLAHPPSIRRDFVRGDTLDALTEFHDAFEMLNSLTLRGTVTSVRGGRVAWRQEQKLTLKQAAPRTAATERWQENGGRKMRYTASIPLAKLEPGAYVLKIEAVGSGARDVSLSREVTFTIRP